MDSKAPAGLLLKDVDLVSAQVAHMPGSHSSDPVEQNNRNKKRKLAATTDAEPSADCPMRVALVQVLATAITTAAMQTLPCMAASPETTAEPTRKDTTVASHQEPIVEVRDGVEWVSFVYSHNRTLKRHTIRTDIHTVTLDMIDDAFKQENCVYPRANLTRESYQGNRWAYETECNVLGWKLAWLNKDVISGKRGLIQRAVDSYRNRCPSMRSRRVARQEKLIKGTLRKRKSRDPDEKASPDATKAAHHLPKTVTIDDVSTGMRVRVKVHVESVNLDAIPMDFRLANSVYPRAMAVHPSQSKGNRACGQEEATCNELGWKLAWLNQRHLAGKKCLLQRVLDMYRTKFAPLLQPRKNSYRCPAVPMPLLTTIPTIPTMPLTASALSAQNAWFAQQYATPAEHSSSESCTSGTTESLDFGDCFSLVDEPSSTLNPDDHALTYTISSPAITPPYSPSGSGMSLGCSGSGHSSISSVSPPSPPAASHMFGDLHDSFLPSASDAFLLAADFQQSREKCFDPVVCSPSLPSSAVQQHDLVKIEGDCLFSSDYAIPVDAEHLLNSLY